LYPLLRNVPYTIFVCRVRTALSLCLVVLATACASPGGAPGAPMTFAPGASSAPLRSIGPLAGVAQNVYWALFAPQPAPQLEIAREPLKKSSRVHVIGGSGNNVLQEASSVRFHQNFAWILTQPNGSTAASVLLIFQLPITKSSTPLYYDTLGGAGRRSHRVRWYRKSVGELEGQRVRVQRQFLAGRRQLHAVANANRRPQFTAGISL
jgi:hypothetical protein